MKYDLGLLTVLTLLASTANALAQDVTTPRPSPVARETPPADPTGGAWTTPTLLFIPAGAVPVWNVRVIASMDMQGPSAPDRLATGQTATTSANPLARFGIQPGLGLEIGLPLGFTLAGGTNWVGGDPSGMAADLGLSPYFQLRYHILGDNLSGLGWQLGASATYKFVGFEGDPGEIELAFSAQYRRPHWEVGLQGVLGKDFASDDADAELHLYGVYRVIPQLALGVAGQGRVGLAHDPDEPPVDLVSGAIASLTLGRWQVAGLAGESTLSLNNGPTVRAGAFGEIFASARF